MDTNSNWFHETIVIDKKRETHFDAWSTRRRVTDPEQAVLAKAAGTRRQPKTQVAYRLNW